MNFEIYQLLFVQESNTYDRSSVEQGFGKFVTHSILKFIYFFKQNDQFIRKKYTICLFVF